MFLCAARRLRSGWVGVFLALSGPCFAWVYPEHRDIAVLGVQVLDPQRAAAFDKLWKEARLGHENRLCELPAVADQGTAPLCLDWAALPAIAGDHSCSSKDMLDVVLRSQWILNVADVAAQLKEDLSRVPVVPAPGQQADSDGMVRYPDFARRIQGEKIRSERLNALRTSDIRLQRADPAYATRAGANNAHFLLARPTTQTGIDDYAGITIGAGAELNAVGVYSYFHLSALQKATRLANESFSPEQRSALVRAMLADEAFALHFLQDTFAAGHVSGTWGSTSQRKGTHDFYNANGLEVLTWDHQGGTLVIMGDAHMRPDDAKVAAQAVRASLDQLIDAAAGKPVPGVRHSTAVPVDPESLDVCNTITFPRRPPGQQFNKEVTPVLAQTLQPTPVPGLGPGLGSMPRFRSELGTFIGLAGSLEARGVSGGFAPGQSDNGVIFGLDLGFRAGVGPGRRDRRCRATAWCSDRSACTPTLRRPTTSSTALGSGGVGGSLTAAIPSRTGFSLRARMPFYLVPGDLLLMSPLYLFDPEAYSQMAVTASNGGLIPWQLGMSTRIGRFQFVLGRELGVTFYGCGFDRFADRTAQRRQSAQHRRLQVHLLRPADPGVPALPLLRQQPEFVGDVPAVRRHRRALRLHHRGATGRAVGEAEPDLLARLAHGLRLALLPMRRLFLLGLVLLLVGCAAPPPAPPRVAQPPQQALAAQPTGTFVDLESKIRAAHGASASGFMLLDSNADGLRWRLALIDSARHSIDLQYYTWFGDVSGRFLLKRVIDAADRGVKVRLLIDDLNTLLRDASTPQIRDGLVAAIDAHPNIQVRLFNPWTRRDLFGRAAEMLDDLDRLNQRMHNKQLVVDNRAAIIGGRNIGDEYLGLNPAFNFRDLDVLGIGPVARQASTVFDRFWNSEWVLPVLALHVPLSEIESQPKRKQLVAELAAEPALAGWPIAPQSWSAEIAALGPRLHAGTSRVVSDQPDDGAIRHTMLEHAREFADGAQRELLVENAYIIPAQPNIDWLRSLTQRGVQVSIVTNSLASHDVPAVNSHYKKWRKPMIEAGRVALRDPPRRRGAARAGRHRAGAFRIHGAARQGHRGGRRSRADRLDEPRPAFGRHQFRNGRDRREQGAGRRCRGADPSRHAAGQQLARGARRAGRAALGKQREDRDAATGPQCLAACRGHHLHGLPARLLLNAPELAALRRPISLSTRNGRCAAAQGRCGLGGAVAGRLCGAAARPVRHGHGADGACRHRRPGRARPARKLPSGGVPAPAER